MNEHEQIELYLMSRSNDEYYKHNLDILCNVPSNSIKRNSQGKIVAIVGYMFNNKGMITKVKTSNDNLKTRKKRMSRNDEADDQFLNDFIGNKSN